MAVAQRNGAGLVEDCVMSLDKHSAGHDDCRCSRRQMVRSLVAGSLLMPGLVHELLAEDAPRRATSVTRSRPGRRIFRPRPSR